MLLLPYYPFPYDTGDYDRTYYPSSMETVPKPFAIVRANEHMIKTSDYLICYDIGTVGKMRDFVALALRREKKGLIHVTNLATRETTYKLHLLRFPLYFSHHEMEEIE